MRRSGVRLFKLARQYKKPGGAILDKGTPRAQGCAYVQDERYTAGAGMRTTAGMQEVGQSRSSCRGAVPIKLAPRKSKGYPRILPTRQRDAVPDFVTRREYVRVGSFSTSCLARSRSQVPQPTILGVDRTVIASGKVIPGGFCQPASGVHYLLSGHAMNTSL